MKVLPAALTLVCVLVAVCFAPRATMAESLKWRYATGGQVYSSPVLGPDGTLYVGSNDKHIYAIDTGVNCTCGACTFLNSSTFTSCSALAAVCPPCPIASNYGLR